MRRTWQRFVLRLSAVAVRHSILKHSRQTHMQENVCILDSLSLSFIRTGGEQDRVLLLLRIHSAHAALSVRCVYRSEAFFAGVLRLGSLTIIRSVRLGLATRSHPSPTMLVRPRGRVRLVSASQMIGPFVHVLFHMDCARCTARALHAIQALVPQQVSWASPSSARAMACETSNSCIPGEAHRPGKRRCSQPRYWLYQAASEGCLPCVQRLVRDGVVDVRCTSENQGYSALDFAKWAQLQGVAGAKEVVAFLAQETGVDAASQSSTGQSAAEPVPSRDCSPGVSHPPSKRRRADRKCWLFGAASAGCLRCVRHYVEDESVDPLSRSETNGWTALDFAEWARQQGVAETTEVEAYLAVVHLVDVCAGGEDPSSAATLPESDPGPAEGPGMKLMRRQGWRPGQGLGKRDHGRREPVEADQSRLSGQRHGLGFHAMPPPK